MLRSRGWTVVLGVSAFALGCDDPAAPQDPDTAPRAMIDRFSSTAGMLFVRDASNGLPAAGQPVNFDQGPFITQGYGPSGQVVQYYNFDVQPTTAAPIFVLFREGDDEPVPDQLNIVDAIPGDDGYNDFWRVVRVTVPRDYIANTVTSLAEIQSAGYPMETTNTIVNCPIVPEGSTATKRLGGGGAGLVQGWYRGQAVFYFTFDERALTTTTGVSVPVSPIYVTFNINPDLAGGGPPSGFKTEPGTSQTHNVVATVPADASYSPLWTVNVYDNADFASVRNLATAQAARVKGSGVALVNCPVVFIQ